MKKSGLIILVFLLLLFAACRKVFVPDSDNPSHSGAINNPTSYELVSETWSKGATNAWAALSFSYNKQNLVSGIVANTITLGPQPNNLAATATTFQIQYDNGLISTITDNIGDRDTLTYNSDGQLTQERAGPQNVVDRTFSYDNRGNLVHLVEDYGTDKWIYSHTFSYDSLNDLVTEVDSQSLDTSLIVDKFQWSDYDNKVEFSLAVNGFPPSLFAFLLNFGGGFNGQGSAIMSPHNAGTETFSAVYDDPAASVAPDEFPFTYQYNDQSLPVMIQYAGWTVTLQYQAY